MTTGVGLPQHSKHVHKSTGKDDGWPKASLYIRHTQAVLAPEKKDWGCIWVSSMCKDRFLSLNNIMMHLKLKELTFYRVPCTLLNPCRTGPALRWQSQRIVWAQIRGCRPRRWILAQLCDVHTIRVMLQKRRSSFTSCFCDSKPQAADRSDCGRCSFSSIQTSGTVQSRENRRMALGGHTLPFLLHSFP